MYNEIVMRVKCKGLQYMQKQNTRKLVENTSKWVDCEMGLLKGYKLNN